ncbi:bifunctional DNA primase/polymerase [Streptomyces noursei]|uniref:bifunctional DNA primase/polymerase n=1 Tax=Streptomyces noursei TaxID=1971 RepID=UPI0016734D56|nr:bifunctional DNA primase/polymerase [Streptomyces noursei]MCZ1017010.1 bifunctional DNA primase/polymerase [Streptomyces noursei]GGX05306.1 DNA primase [Streptomyces noursei]
MATPHRHTAPTTAHPATPAFPPDPPADLRPDPPPARPLAPADAHHAALAHALHAAEHGYPVIPLTRTKLPALRSPHHDHHAHGAHGAHRTRSTRDEPVAPPCHGSCGRLGHGVHDATTDPLTIRRMFAAAPWATGYGIACGRAPHHLVGIDLDTKHGTDGHTALRLIAAAHGFPLPPTVTVLTPSGGRHLWFTGPPAPPVPNSAGRLAPGIDVRGAGGYLVGPGSLTTHGRYVLAPDAPRRPAPAPPALLALLLPPLGTPPPPPYATPHGHRQPPADALLRFVRASPRGQRNTRLFWAACRAYEAGLGPELAERLVAAARHTGLPESEARATLASASRH